MAKKKKKKETRWYEQTQNCCWNLAAVTSNFDMEERNEFLQAEGGKDVTGTKTNYSLDITVTQIGDLDLYLLEKADN